MTRTIPGAFAASSGSKLLGPLALVLILAFGVPARATQNPAATKTPVPSQKPTQVRGPQDVGLDELAGMVVDADGKPLEGVEVDAWTWYPGNETRTDAKGWFRLKGLGKDRKIEVSVRKENFTPQLFVSQPTGGTDWVIVLGNKTYFEGTVSSQGGKPVADTLIRANQGPKRGEGVVITEIWTEARTDSAGHYRMYAQADVYDIQVRVPGVGTARLQATSLEPNEAKQLDAIKPRAAEREFFFAPKTVDSVTGKPVAGVRLWHWQHKGVDARSDENGLVTVADMLPGAFNFMVECKDYARWWSEQCSTQWSRRLVEPARDGGLGWQRNFDHLDFELRPGMETVTITLEPGVKIAVVLDPRRVNWSPAPRWRRP